MRSFLSARAKRNSGISSISISQNFVQEGDENSWVLSDSFKWDIGLKIKYLYALNDLSFMGMIIKTSGVEIVDKQSNSFHVWRLGNKMSLILIYKIHSSTQMYPVTSTGKRTLIKRPVIVTLVRLSWTLNLVINFLFPDAEAVEISPSAKMWLNTFLTDQPTKGEMVYIIK